MYYTYAYLDETKTPYYIGNAKHRPYGNKYYRTLQKHYCDIPPTDRILILKDNLSKEEADKHETYLISVFGRKLDGGLLENMSIGGQGTLGLSRPEEERNRISESKKGMSFSKQHKTSLREARKGKVWWNNGKEETLSKETPGPEWKRGRRPK